MFKNIGKFIGGGLGWTLGGPFGAILGVAFGSMIDSLASGQQKDETTTRGDFTVSLLVLVAAMMKADGVVRKSELNYVKHFLIRNFGREGAQEALNMLKDILKQDIPLEPVCQQIRSNMNYSLRLQLIYFLINLANIDNDFNASEERMLLFIAVHVDISAQDIASIRSMFQESEQQTYQSSRSNSSTALDRAYSVLGIDKSADADAIKKAYRAMAVKYHPDKVAYLGDDMKKAANEKFQHLNEAYELVKKDKGMI
ncbi:MAG: DnaJ domain-containing protein [Bacteroidales bacterium]|jgi:DnaJ like chaperone protein|nr:DnaJ domain-containing protein [Bacteroidales bacterium]